MSTVCSNDSSVSGRAPESQPASRSSAAMSPAKSKPSASEVCGVLDLEDDADLTAVRGRAHAPDRARRASATLAAVHRSSRSSSAPPELAHGTAASRISSQVKSSVNHPVRLLPSIVLVVRRPANSGRSATSVVPEISFSCQTPARHRSCRRRRAQPHPPHREREIVGRTRVLRAVSGGAAVTNDQRITPAGHPSRLIGCGNPPS